MALGKPKNLTSELSAERINLQSTCFEFLMNTGKIQDSSLDKVASYAANFQNAFESPNMKFSLDRLALSRVVYLEELLKSLPAYIQFMYYKIEGRLQSYMGDRGIIETLEDFEAKNYDIRLLLFLLAQPEELARLILIPQPSDTPFESPKIAATQRGTQIATVLAA